MKRTFYKTFFTGLAILCSSMPACSQEQQIDKQKLLKLRMSQIDRYHAGIGLGGEIYKNQGYYLQVFAGYGSCRNLFSVDAGLRYRLTNPITRNGSDDVSLSHVAVYAAADVNFLRQKDYCLYTGAELAWNAAASGKYYHKNSSGTINDRSLGRSYASAKLRLGTKLSNQWRIEIYYAYDLAPAFDQKYVFESAQYDYDAVHDQLFERGRLGITFAYQLNF